jgi:signal transduction histidine kinase
MIAPLDPSVDAEPCATCVNHQEEVQRWLARELHDRVVSALTTILLDMETLKTNQTAGESVVQEVSELQTSTREAINGLRQLLHELRSTRATEDNFIQNVRTKVLSGMVERSGLEVSLRVDPNWPARLTSTAAHHLYGILREALNNVRLHSGASSAVIAFTLTPETTAVVSITDDGRGVQTLESALPSGMGWLGIRERAVLMGGSVRVEPATPRGTSVIVEFPVENLL